MPIFMALWGISEYLSPDITNLPEVSKDLEHMREIAATHDIEVIADLQNEDGNTALRKLRSVAASMGRTDHLILYFSGHGFSLDGNDYIVPPEAFLDDFEILKRVLVPINLYGSIGKSSAASITVLVDACREGLEFGKKGLALEDLCYRPIENHHAVTQLIYSCSKGQISSVLNDKKGSLFTYSFYQAIFDDNYGVGTIENIVQQTQLFLLNNCDVYGKTRQDVFAVYSGVTKPAPQLFKNTTIDSEHNKHDIDSALAQLTPISLPNGQLAKPLPPLEPHKYVLNHQGGFVGREQEQADLLNWLKPDADHPIVVIQALGGMGKSALAWKIFQELTRGENNRYDAAVWWSFYEPDGTVANFASQCIAYLSGLGRTTAEKQSAEENLRDIIKFLDTHNVLIVLDGLERIQLGYTRQTKLQGGDHEYSTTSTSQFADELSDPVGHSSRDRRLVNEAFAYFLTNATQSSLSNILITTRTFPSDLESGNERVSGVKLKELDGFELKDCLELTTRYDIQFSAALISRYFKEIEFYPLAVRAMIGSICNVDPLHRRFDFWLKMSGIQKLSDLPLKQRHRHVLEIALANLGIKELYVLALTTVYRSAPRYQDLCNALLGPAKYFETTAELDAVLISLGAAGLLGWERSSGTCDLHPVVRDAVWQGLGVVGREHMLKLSSNTALLFDIDQPNNQHSLRGLFFSLLEVGRFDEATSYLFTNWKIEWHERRSDFELFLEMLQALIEQDQSLKPRDDYYHWLIWSYIGHTINSFGYASKSLPYLENAIVTGQQNDELAVSHLDLSSAHYHLGNIEEAFSSGIAAFRLDGIESATRLICVLDALHSPLVQPLVTDLVKHAKLSSDCTYYDLSELISVCETMSQCNFDAPPLPVADILFDYVSDLFLAKTRIKSMRNHFDFLNYVRQFRNGQDSTRFDLGACLKRVRASDNPYREAQILMIQSEKSLRDQNVEEAISTAYDAQSILVHLEFRHLLIRSHLVMFDAALSNEDLALAKSNLREAFNLTYLGDRKFCYAKQLSEIRNRVLSSLLCEDLTETLTASRGQLAPTDILTPYTMPGYQRSIIPKTIL